MFGKKLLLSLLSISPVFVEAMLPIHVKSFRFIQPASPANNPEENKVFFVKGVDYQPGGSSGYDSSSNEDVLSNPDICARDVFAFQQLGINTIRIYSLNPDLNHDKCMTILNDAGIYVIIGVNSGNSGENLNRADPKGSYNAQYLTRVFKMIEAFKDYPNVLGFFSGNEVINNESNYAETVPPYIRAVQRDMKQYIAKHSNRSIPVGYSAADNTDLRLATFKYLQCNSFDGKTVNKALNESRSDFYGLNSYQWCSGSSTWESSGFAELNSTFSDAVIPLIFSEYGCNKHIPRTFDEVTDAIYTNKGLEKLFSGGLVYEYSEEANNYGLVVIDNENDTITYKQGFVNLKNRFAETNISTIYEDSVSDKTIYKCDSNAILEVYSNFGVSNFTIPAQPKEITYLINNGVSNATVGKILSSSNYTVPTSVKYTVKNQNGDIVSASIVYNPANTLNELDNADYTAKSISISSTSTTSTSTSTSVSSTLSTSTFSSSTKSTSSKSKGNAAAMSLPIQPGIFAMVLSLLL